MEQIFFIILKGIILLTKKKTNNKQKISNENLQNNNQKKIDRILDKISESGYDSLTREEKRVLNDASKD